MKRSWSSRDKSKNILKSDLQQIFYYNLPSYLLIIIHGIIHKKIIIFTPKLIMMILNLFRIEDKNLIFSEKDWTREETRNSYSLSLEISRIKIRSSTKFILYVLQGSRYVFLSESSEELAGTKLQYVSHFPFAGKVVIR